MKHMPEVLRDGSMFAIILDAGEMGKLLTVLGRQLGSDKNPSKLLPGVYHTVIRMGVMVHPLEMHGEVKGFDGELSHGWRLKEPAL